MASGASANARAFYSTSPPFQVAVLRGHEEVMKVLLAACADANAKANSDLTALRVASGLTATWLVPLLEGCGRQSPAW